MKMVIGKYGLNMYKNTEFKYKASFLFFLFYVFYFYVDTKTKRGPDLMGHSSFV